MVMKMKFLFTLSLLVEYSSDKNKEVITKDKMSWYLDKFSLPVP